MKRNLTILTIFLVALGISTIPSCSFRPKPVTIKTYVIDSGVKITGAIKPQATPFPYTLIMPPIIGALPFRTKKILYRTSDITLSPYLYSRWEYAPTHMLMTKMLKALDRANLFKAVLFRATGAHGNLYLETTLFDFTHHVDLTSKTSYGVINVMFQIIDGKTRNILRSKTFLIKKEAPSIDAEGAARALSAASDELCLELVDWLKKTGKGLSGKS